MRPNQNNKRMRGRNNNRKGPNPLSRSYELNGPDVKIRGTAHHIGEKYLQLARDAQSSGDPVMAESYLQHAEHYFRLIAAAQQAQQASFGYNRQAGEPEPEELEEEEDFASLPDRFASPIERVSAQPQQQPQPQPQPYTPPQPQHNGHPSYQERERPSFGSSERPNYERQDRSNRQERGFQDRGGFSERPGQPSREADQRGGRGRGPRDFRADAAPRYERHEPRVHPGDGSGNGLPAFITAPVRLQPETTQPISEEQTFGSEVMQRPDTENEATGFHLRPRRRRRGKGEFGEAESPPVKDPFGE